MEIRRAAARDCDGINRLLRQVLEVHHSGRPDLFRGGVKKYTDEQLTEILADDSRPVFVLDEQGCVLGYAFCIFKSSSGSNILTDLKTLYLDDLCVDESRRGQQLGRQMLDYVLDFARRSGCYNVTLNVWACNPGARRFYEKCGLVPRRTEMEKIL